MVAGDENKNALNIKNALYIHTVAFNAFNKKEKEKEIKMKIKRQKANMKVTTMCGLDGKRMAFLIGKNAQTHTECAKIVCENCM